MRGVNKLMNIRAGAYTGGRGGVLKNFYKPVNKMKNFAGTVRQNRTVGVPLPTKTEAARSMIRGTMKATYNDEICLAVWRDSQPVYLASNF